MYPNSVYIGLKSGPCLGTLGPKYILFGYMDLFKLSMRKKASLSTQGLLRNLVVLLILTKALRVFSSVMGSYRLS